MKLHYFTTPSPVLPKAEADCGDHENKQVSWAGPVTEAHSRGKRQRAVSYNCGHCYDVIWMEKRSSFCSRSQPDMEQALTPNLLGSKQLETSGLLKVTSLALSQTLGTRKTCPSCLFSPDTDFLGNKI